MHSKMRLVEQTMEGGVVSGSSSTVTAKVQLLVLPLKSDTEHPTAVVPRGNRLPGAGEQTTVRFVSQASVAVTR